MRDSEREKGISIWKVSFVGLYLDSIWPRACTLVAAWRVAQSECRAHRLPTGKLIRPQSLMHAISAVPSLHLARLPAKRQYIISLGPIVETRELICWAPSGAAGRVSGATKEGLQERGKVCCHSK